MIQPCFKFINEDEDYIVVLIYGTERKNIALLIRENTACPFITVRDLSELKNGNFSWAWGHYFSDIRNAIDDYDMRKKYALVFSPISVFPGEFFAPLFY